MEVLYAADVRGVDVDAVLADRSEELGPYTRHLLEGVGVRREEIDRLIREHAPTWRLERMSAVDRNCLRVGVLELLEGDVPAPAVIDEAIEVAKRFSGDEAGGFVNGVLEAVRADLQGDDVGGPSGRSSSSSSSSGEGGGSGSPSSGDG